MFIESAQNKFFKELLKLKDKKFRDESGLFLVEGEKQVSEIDKTWNIDKLIISENYKGAGELTNNKNLVILSDKLFAKISGTKTPQGIIAAVSKKTYKTDSILNEKGLFVVLENIQDPGNLGTIIRTADAFGAKAVFVSAESADIYSEKVIRSTMGSIFHLPVITNTNINDLISSLKTSKIPIVAATLNGKDTKIPATSALFIGNEASGLSAKTQESSDICIKIEMAGKAESLNAAVAAGILMFKYSLNL